MSAVERPRRTRRDTPVTLVQAAPSMAELNAEAWRRAREGRSS